MATAALGIYPATVTVVTTGGTAVAAIPAAVAGGVITNPLSAMDQGLAVAEPLYVDPIGTATVGAGFGTVALAPGASFPVPANATTPITVNAATSGHKFSAILYQPQVFYPPTIVPSAFPPSGPTGLTSVIKAYPYKQYDDDDDIAAFFSAYNGIAQDYIDTLNDLNLPIYTRPVIAGALLDWVGTGLYGMARPQLSSQRRQVVGPFNTSVINGAPFNGLRFLTTTDVIATSDDIYKRILTWHLYKGDGKVFDVRWLKRRIMRFLTGTNGTAGQVDTSYQVSVTFGTGNNVSIRLLHGLRTVRGGAMFNRFALNGMPFNALRTTYTAYAPLQYAEIFQDAVNTGALELPFQFDFSVTI